MPTSWTIRFPKAPARIASVFSRRSADSRSNRLAPESFITQSAGTSRIGRGKWKLLLARGSGGWTSPTEEQVPEGSPPAQLYDMGADPGETNNLYASRPEVAERLLALLKSDVERGRSTDGVQGTKKETTFRRSPFGRERIESSAPGNWDSKQRWRHSAEMALSTGSTRSIQRHVNSVQNPCRTASFHKRTSHRKVLSLGPTLGYHACLGAWVDGCDGLPDLLAIIRSGCWASSISPNEYDLQK